MSKLLFDEREGYSFVSDSNIIYDLYEGFSLKGETTSDIVFIMLSYSNFKEGDDEDEIFYTDFCDLYGEPEKYVGWFYGASLLEGEENELYKNDMIDMCEKYIVDFERENKEMISFILNHNKNDMIDKIKQTVESYLLTNEDVLSVKDKVNLNMQINYLKELKRKFII